jgi:glyoxylase-like metal-dependent hydrolase (beta-lactamase superfamily II)
MRIHHLGCGSLCPHGARLINGEGGLLAPASIVCHCLLIEADDQLVLVDTGFGVDDANNPRQLGMAFRALLRPRPRVETTAVRQVEALGFSADDVRHIVTTHLDLDHAGGLPDFPAAEVHVLAPELEAALHPKLGERTRYARGVHWSHGPNWVRHEGGGDSWFGFEGVRILPGIDAEILLIPLVGHTRGHAAVAINSADGWLLHCGDAYFHRGEISTPAECPALLRFFQAAVAADNKARRSNRERLGELAAHHGDEVDLLCAHDPRDLERAQAGAGVATPSG